MAELNDKDVIKTLNHVDDGLWTVYVDKQQTVYVQSSDFRHDAMLKIIGDFEDLEAKKEYARLLCNKLNFK